MKKSIILMLILIVLSSAIVGCSRDSKTTEQYVPAGTYVMQESEEPIKPSISLKDDNRFTFTYSALSSYLPIGSYEVDNGVLTLITDDGKYTYIFAIKDNTLIFNATESSEISSYVDLPDGSVFK